MTWTSKVTRTPKWTSDGEETGIALPYVVTMIKGTNDIWPSAATGRKTTRPALKRQHFVHYQYIPGFGAYGFGLFHLIGGFAKSATRSCVSWWTQERCLTCPAVSKSGASHQR